MNAFNNVNIASACVLMSTETARKFGIPEDRWIYPLGGAGTRDAYSCKFYRVSTIVCHADVGSQFGRDQISIQVPLYQNL